MLSVWAPVSYVILFTGTQQGRAYLLLFLYGVTAAATPQAFPHAVLPLVWVPQGRCAAVVLYRHQLAVLPALRVEDDSAGLSYLGFPTGTPGIPKALFSTGRGSNGDLKGVPGLPEDGGGPLGPAAGGSAAATLGNSYVDNLAKAGIKEVGCVC